MKIAFGKTRNKRNRRKTHRRGGAAQTDKRTKIAIEIISVLNYKQVPNTGARVITQLEILGGLAKLNDIEVKALEDRIRGLVNSNIAAIFQHLYGKSIVTNGPARSFLDNFRGELCSILGQYNINCD